MPLAEFEPYAEQQQLRQAARIGSASGTGVRVPVRQAPAPGSGTTPIRAASASPNNAASGAKPG